ncbi:enoyl-CoA hydratase/isomerase family protein [Nocardioides sp.]|uniref:enoyl-CoA hydratase/isomerase family protein n=1 Tax=Nocardioides sp. TaxID=35761 RepID=UPI00262AFC68|nr:enoyl-CoA hydratase/isomerase family protein [Nocardioides sp.]
MSEETNAAGVLLSVDSGVAHLVLNRPAAANSFDLPTALDLVAAVERCAADDIRVVVVTGAGKRFCAGGDVASFVAAEARDAYIHELASVLGGALRALSDLAKPVVAGVHGAVAGAGLGFVLAADLVVAERATKFTMAFAGIGLTPDSGVSYLLPRVVGLRRALDLTVNQRVLSADTALEWDLVTEVVDGSGAAEVAGGTAAERALEIGRTLAAGPALALGQARRLLRSGLEVSRDVHAADEARTISRAVVGDEASALIDAFLNR